MKTLISGGRVIDPANGIDQILDLLIEDDRIALVAEKIDCSGIDRTIAARKMLVCPGFIDMHVHLRDPGLEHKEDIASGTAAAVAGGFTTVACMPNTKPVVDNAVIVEYIISKARREGRANVLPIGSITKGLKGEEISEMGDMKRAGAVGFSDDGRPVMNSEVMRLAMEYASMLGLPIFDHCEDMDLAHEGAMNLGAVSTVLGLKGIPAAAEEIQVARDVLLSRLTGAHVHICHASTRGSVDIIRWAKSTGARVTAEACPHHFSVTDELVRELRYDTSTKVNPPLRTADDVKAIKQGLKDGTIDVIATDHAPHHKDDKDVEYTYAASGISGIETAVSLVWTKLVLDGTLPASEAVRRLTVAPAMILGIDRGTLGKGKVADVTLVDPEADTIVRPESFVSKGKNSPFGGFTLRARPYMTIVSGKVQYQAVTA
ncbi:MAG: dihydroorotase [Bacillota bacterium]|nr:dihydroorotase [Bacillota bacterium]